MTFPPTRAEPVMYGFRVGFGARALTVTPALVASTAGCPALRAPTATVSCLPRSVEGTTYEEAVAPGMETPLAFHW
ncbi:hypothetical protein AMK29_23475 [Streptomyces sp. CB02261]|nr:hypothetical protein AMK29_23475 [Streptomyces sp. CB02261]